MPMAREAVGRFGGGLSSDAHAPCQASSVAMTPEQRAELDSLPLSGLYSRSIEVYKQIHGSSDTPGCPDTPAERDVLIDKALVYLRRAEDVCERAALFSDNESIDDVKTSDVKYLLLPSLLAELVGEQPDLALRPAALEKSEEAYMRFLDRCVTLGAAPSSCVDACRRLLKRGGSSQGLQDAAAQRNERIARHRFSLA